MKKEQHYGELAALTPVDQSFQQTNPLLTVHTVLLTLSIRNIFLALGSHAISAFFFLHI